MRPLYSLALAAALSLPGAAALADTVSAAAVPTTYAGSSTDYISFNALNATNVANGGSFTQTGIFYIGSNSAATKIFNFSDTFTVNGISQTLVFNATDYITNSFDRLVIDAMNNVAFGSVLVSFSPTTVTGTTVGSFALSLTGTVTDKTTPALTTPTVATTSEPPSVLLLLSGLLAAAALILRKSTPKPS